MRKLQSIIQESMQGFDDNLTQLFMKKIKIMMVIYQVCPPSFFLISTRFVIWQSNQNKTYLFDMLQYLWKGSTGFTDFLQESIYCREIEFY